LDIVTYAGPTYSSSIPLEADRAHEHHLVGTDATPYWALCVIEVPSSTTSGAIDGQLVAYKFADDTCSGTPVTTVIVADFDSGSVSNEAPYELCVDHTGDDVFEDADGTYTWVLSE
jgi:hypothetical protein